MQDVPAECGPGPEESPSLDSQANPARPGAPGEGRRQERSEDSGDTEGPGTPEDAAAQEEQQQVVQKEEGDDLGWLVNVVLGSLQVPSIIITNQLKQQII